jgi:hypothetical protein
MLAVMINERLVGIFGFLVMSYLAVMKIIRQVSESISREKSQYSKRRIPNLQCDSRICSVLTFDPIVSVVRLHTGQRFHDPQSFILL